LAAKYRSPRDDGRVTLTAGDPRREDRPERPLGQPVGRRGSWRLPALVVAAVLGLIVVVARLDMSPGDVASGPTEPTASPAATRTARPLNGPLASPRPLPLATAAPPVRVAGHGRRYGDGIPGIVGGEPVRRLPDVAETELGRPLVVGGWYRTTDCDLSGYGWTCLPELFADNPATLLFPPTEAVRLISSDLSGSGPAVVRGRLTEGDCSSPGWSDEPDPARCPRELTVSEVLWQGDRLTEAGPIEVVPLMATLAAAFPDFRPTGVIRMADCQEPWPAQTYRSTSSPIRVVALLPSSADATADAESLTTTGTAMLRLDCGGGPVQANPFVWLGNENALLLVNAGVPHAVELARGALAGALPASGVVVAGDKEDPAR
jgi:hypothetical protein